MFIINKLNKIPFPWRVAMTWWGSHLSPFIYSKQQYGQQQTQQWPSRNVGHGGEPTECDIANWAYHFLDPHLPYRNPFVWHTGTDSLRHYMHSIPCPRTGQREIGREREFSVINNNCPINPNRIAHPVLLIQCRRRCRCCLPWLLNECRVKGRKVCYPEIQAHPLKPLQNNIVYCK